MPNALSTAAWQQLRARVLAASNVCAICNKPIDLALSGRHPYGPTVDHWVPRSAGGDLMNESNCFPAHNRCNSAKSNKLISRSSRDW